MRVVFMGTPEFAACSLQRLYDDSHTVLAVFTQPDRPKNRGMKLTQSPVKLLAAEHDTPVYQPDSLKDEETERRLRELSPELIVAVAYGKLLPKSILTIPEKGCINIHGSLLPKYRGAAPIQWTILSGDDTAGVTAIQMSEKMDAGDILGAIETPVAEKETSEQLFDRLAVLGAELLSQTIHKLEAGSVQAVPQIDEQASYAPMLTKALCPIDWTRPGRMIIKQICGLNPWPIATVSLTDMTLKVYDANFVSYEQSERPGTVLSAGTSGIEFACSDGSVFLKEVQAPGKKRMAAADFLRGHPIC